MNNNLSNECLTNYYFSAILLLQKKLKEFIMDFAQFLIKGKLQNVILKTDFVNKETGEVKPGKVILQFLINNQGQLDFLNVTASKAFYQKLLPKKNQIVELPVIIKVFNGKIFYNLNEEVFNG